MTVKTWTLYDACACVEGFDGIEHDDETTISAWQFLKDVEASRFLQGWYGRTIQALTDDGYLN